MLPMRFFNATVDHFDKDIGIFVELNHELLHLLHLSEAIIINNMSVVEE